jgi:hypothetical protein
LSSPTGPELRALQNRALDLYLTLTLLMLIGIGVLIVYSILLGPLTSPGAEQSFGYAVALMSLMGALLFHLIDRMYRCWPFGRKFRPTPPGPVSEGAQVRFLKIVVVAVAAAAIAYLLGSLVA